nr:hypothetical protein [Bradyrhizobium sp. CCBAU 51627]
MEQYGLAFDRLVTKPERLGKAAADEAEGRCSPAGLASAPAPLEISRQHLEQRQIPDRVGIARVDRQRLVKGRERRIQQLQAPQGPRLFVERRREIRTERERAVEACEGQLHPLQSRVKRAEVLVRLRLGGIQRNGSLEVGLCLVEPAQPLQA